MSPSASLMSDILSEDLWYHQWQQMPLQRGIDLESLSQNHMRQGNENAAVLTP